ncbi:MAG: ADP-ribosylglycohydrolase [Nitriliruptor sp.]|nr:MAG: ADP-ribosylglycohydrolase [Nitriliruptor sp.]
MSRSDRARGVLLGLALGDALGAPFEGRSQIAGAQVAAWIDAREPLRWTDDTHMALTLARHLVDDPQLDDPEALGTAFARAYAREPWRGYGSGPPQVFAMVEQGLRFEEAAGTLFGGSGSFGNGAAMRVAPVGLLPAATDPRDAARLAAVQARVTHTHPDAIAGATVVAQVIAGLIDAERINADAIVGVVSAATGRLSPGPVHDGLIDVLDVVGSGGDAATAAGRCGTGVAAAESVPAAIAALLAGGGDVLQVVTTAIGFGGDTDTIAAMAGALAGAARGLEHLPDTLLDRLEARADLEQLAQTLSCR